MTVRRIIACILLPCYLVACSTWTTQEASPQQVLQDEQPDKVRVTLTDGSQVEVYEPAVSGDTLTGFEKGRGDEVSIPLGEVEQLSLRGFSTLKTVALVGGMVVGVPLALFAIAAATCPKDADCF